MTDPHLGRTPLFISSKYVDAAVLSASSAESSLPVNYLQGYRPEQVWRATSTTASITVDFGRAIACNALALFGHNLSSDATIQVELADTEPGLATPALNTTALSAWPLTVGRPNVEDWSFYASIVQWSNTTPRRWAKVTIADPSNADGYVQASRLMMAPALQLTYAVDMNPAIGLFSADQKGRTPYNRVYADRRGVSARRISIPLSALTEADVQSGLFELQRYCGLAGDFAFCMDPSQTTRFHIYTMQAQFSDNIAYEAQPYFDTSSQLWKATVPMDEVT